MSTLVNAVLHALGFAGSMGWEILWALIVGFLIAGVVQAVVRKATVVRLLGDDKPKTLAIAAGLGAASSSCSYAAVALARSLFRKGANFTAAIAFEIASTNLVVELGIILVLLMGWQFTAAEFIGGPIMIIAVALFFRAFLKKRLVGAALDKANEGLAGSMEGHAAMDMSVSKEGSFFSRLFSHEGFTSVSHVYVMEWAAILRDIVIGLLIAGMIGAWVPNTFWQHLFLAHSGGWSAVWGPIVGPFISVISFVCSVGNVPLAVILWTGGLSFGGVIAFIFSDLIIIPIINIYRKYYGWKMALMLSGILYVAAVVAGYIVDAVFHAVGWVPRNIASRVPTVGISWNYDTYLNIFFLIVTAVLVVRFFRSNGRMMLRMMGGKPESADGMDHDMGGHGGHDMADMHM